MGDLVGQAMVVPGWCAGGQMGAAGWWEMCLRVLGFVALRVLGGRCCRRTGWAIVADPWGAPGGQEGEDSGSGSEESEGEEEMTGGRCRWRWWRWWGRSPAAPPACEARHHVRVRREEGGGRGLLYPFKDP